jgi:hypothetical protein
MEVNQGIISHLPFSKGGEQGNFHKLSLGPTGERERGLVIILEKFIHPELNQPVEFFGGSYVMSEEGKISCRGKEVLYFIGIAGLDASCCGRSGCAFAKVPGIVRHWKKKRDKFGRLVSEVERITDAKSQEEISQWLRERYPQVTQIEFL